MQLTGYDTDSPINECKWLANLIEMAYATGSTRTLEWLYSPIHQHYIDPKYNTFILRRFDHPHVIEWLLQHGFQIVYDEMIVTLSIMRDDFSLIKLLIDYIPQGNILYVAHIIRSINKFANPVQRLHHLCISADNLALASSYNSTKMLDFWYQYYTENNIQLVYCEKSVRAACQAGNLLTLQWWLDKSTQGLLPLIYDHLAFIEAMPDRINDIILLFHRYRQPVLYSSEFFHHLLRSNLIYTIRLLIQFY